MAATGVGEQHRCHVQHRPPPDRIEVPIFRTRDRRVTRLLVTMASAALLTTLSVLAPATAGAAPRLGQSFTVTNLTSQPMQYQSPGPVPSVDGPAPDSWLQPGQSRRLLPHLLLPKETFVEADYYTPGGSYDVQFDVSIINVPTATCSGPSAGQCRSDGVRNVDFFDPPGTSITIPAGQGQRQADILNGLCANAQATCAFTAKSQASAFSASHELWSVQNNTSRDVNYDVEI